MGEMGRTGFFEGFCVGVVGFGLGEVCEFYYVFDVLYHTLINNY